MHERDIPTVMKSVFRLAPYKLWKHRWKEWAEQEKSNPFLTDYFNIQFRIERSFDVTYEYYLARHKVPQLDPLGYELFSFLALLVGVYQRLSPKGQTRLAGSVRDGLRNTSGLVPVEIELRVAAHLMQSGFDVDFTDLEGRQRFDLLATKSGLEIEIDCKSVSGDIGRSIHARRFREFAGHLLPSVRELTQKGGGFLVHITIPGNLQGNIQSLADQANAVITDALSRAPPIEAAQALGKVCIRTFDLTPSPFDQQTIVTEADLSAFLINSLGIRENLNSVTHYVSGSGAVIVVMQSERPDRVIDGIYRQLKDSAGRQFSGERPAVLCVRLREINASQLVNLANGKTNGLAMIATRLLRADNRSHLAGISYISPSGTLSRSAANAVQDRGTAYYFPNPKNPSEAVERLFASGATNALEALGSTIQYTPSSPDQIR
jgi:hypothetical protein